MKASQGKVDTYDESIYRQTSTRWRTTWNKGLSFESAVRREREITGSRMNRGDGGAMYFFNAFSFRARILLEYYVHTVK